MNTFSRESQTMKFQEVAEGAGDTVDAPCEDAIEGRLALKTCGGDTFNELTLEEKVNAEWYEERDRRSGHHEAIALGEGPLQVRYGESDGRHLLIRDRDQRPEEVVPHGEEGEDGESDEHRTNERNDDRREDTAITCSVNPGGLHEVVGDPFDELVDEEDAECVDDGK